MYRSKDSNGSRPTGKMQCRTTVARDGSDPEAALRRIRQQHFDLARVDAVLRNDASLEALSAETDRVFLNLFVSL